MARTSRIVLREVPDGEPGFSCVGHGSRPNTERHYRAAHFLGRHKLFRGDALELLLVDGTWLRGAYAAGTWDMPPRARFAVPPPFAAAAASTPVPFTPVVLELPPDATVRRPPVARRPAPRTS